MRAASVAALVGAALVAGSGGLAQAQAGCSPTHWAPNWLGPVNVGSATTGAGSAVSADTAFNPAGANFGRAFAISGPNLVAYYIANNSNGGAGTPVFPPLNLASSTLDNFPIPVILSKDCHGDPFLCAAGDDATVFLAGDDGFLYKVVVHANGTTTTTSVNLKRTGCAGDKLKGTPAIQLYRYSNTTFQNAMKYAGSVCLGGSNPGTACPNGTGCLGGGTCPIGSHDQNDLVILATNYPDQGGSCPGGQNRVYALYSAGLTTKWVYNQTGTSMELNANFEACALDYWSGTPPPDGLNNLAICAFDQNGSQSANTLVAFQTATSLATGSPKWATNTTSGIAVRPVSAEINGVQRIYVATEDGYLKAFKPNPPGVCIGGTSPGAACASSAQCGVGGICNFDPTVWSTGTHITGGITQNFFAEFRASAGAGLLNHLLVVTTDGTFRRFVDNGTSGSEDGAGLIADPSFTARFISLATPATTVGKILLGRDDGKVQQVNSSFALEEAVQIGGAQSKIFDPAVDIDPLDSTKLQLTVTASGDALGGVPGKIARLTLPFCTSGQGQ